MSDNLPVQKGIWDTNIVLEEGALVPKDTEAVLALATLLYRNKLVSETFKGPNEVVIGLTHCAQMKIPYMRGMRYMYVNKGNVTIWGPLPLEIARKTGKVEYIEEFLVTKEYKRISYKNKNLHEDVYAAVTIVKRRDEEREKETFFSIDDAKTAGLLGKDTYKKYLKDMLQRRSTGGNLKYSFGEVFSGVDIGEFEHGMRGDMLSPVEKDVTEIKRSIEAPANIEIKDAGGDNIDHEHGGTDESAQQMGQQIEESVSDETHDFDDRTSFEEIEARS